MKASAWFGVAAQRQSLALEETFSVIGTCPGPGWAPPAPGQRAVWLGQGRALDGSAPQAFQLEGRLDD